jgi:hypothetical protein
MKLFFLKLDYLIDSKFGWFFTNGRKMDSYDERIKKKEIELLKRINGDKK